MQHEGAEAEGRDSGGGKEGIHRNLEAFEGRAWKEVLWWQFSWVSGRCSRTSFMLTSTSTRKFPSWLLGDRGAWRGECRRSIPWSQEGVRVGLILGVLGVRIPSEQFACRLWPSSPACGQFWPDSYSGSWTRRSWEWNRVWTRIAACYRNRVLSSLRTRCIRLLGFGMGKNIQKVRFFQFLCLAGIKIRKILSRHNSHTCSFS